MARLAIVASCTPATGNLHTALRLRSLLQRLKHTVQLLDCHSPHLHRELQASDAELFIAVHALRSGLPCLRAGVRYLLLCGGEATQPAPLPQRPHTARTCHLSRRHRRERARE